MYSHQEYLQTLLITLLVFTSLTVQGQVLRINEIMASNSTTISDGFGDYSDWIEIYNAGSSTIPVSGWSLTDDESEPRKWSFPDIQLGPDEYLLVFASGRDTVLSNSELHTNFKLDADGEYMALISPEDTYASVLDSAQTDLKTDVSLAYFDGDFIRTNNPTPGYRNELAEDQFIPPPLFSHKHGYYYSRFSLEIKSELTHADIYYTTDGSEPDIENGLLYVSPVNISTTSVVRAVVIKSNTLKSKVATATFLFLDDVIKQPNNPAGYTDTWGPYTAIEGNAIADYEMDPEITRDSRYLGKMEESLLSLPVISIVTDKNNLFSHSTDPDSGGIYIYTGPPGNSGTGLGKGWVRPASVEFFNSDNSDGFQIDCGIKLHGGHSRRPEKSPKHSFRLEFKEEYGAKKLEYPLFGENAVASFSTLVLRAGFGNSWHHWTHGERKRAQFIRDVWAKETQRAMGHLSGHGRYVHLYINGLYWGVYNPTERIDKDFAVSYMGGDDDDFDVMKDYSEVVDGNSDSWKEALQLAGSGMLEDDYYYYKLQGKNPDGSLNPEFKALIDVESLVDYMLLNFYGGNWDWDHHNWIAIRNRISPGKGFKFLSWDSEHILENIEYNNLNEDNGNSPSHIFQALTTNEEFLQLLVDRIQLHFFNGGVLSPEVAAARYEQIADKIELAMIAESARWGDYRRDVHRFSAGGPFELYDKQYWDNEKSFVLNQYFPNRTEKFLEILRNEGWFPDIPAPSILINSEEVFDNYINKGDELSFSGISGEFYYSLDNTDPKTNGKEYTEPIIVNNNIHIKAVRFARNEWSAVTQKVLIVSRDLSDLKITEIHYHPLPEGSIDGDLFEFVELKNISSFPIDLSDAYFSKGISYLFPENSFLLPNEFAVLASDMNYFTMRYGWEPFGMYDNSLANEGETLVLQSASGDTLLAISYNDNSPWPEEADGDGYSLVTVEANPTGDLNDPSYWTRSMEISGSPGSNRDIETGIADYKSSLPSEYRLYQNYPNPFNPSTTITYSLPAVVTGRDLSLRQVKLVIHDILGREVITLVNKEQKPGKYKVAFNGTALVSGIYFYKIQAGEFSGCKKMLLIK